MTTAQVRDRLPRIAAEAAIGGIDTVLVNRDLEVAVIIGFKRYEELLALEAKHGKK